MAQGKRFYKKNNRQGHPGKIRKQQLQGVTIHPKEESLPKVPIKWPAEIQIKKTEEIRKPVISKNVPEANPSVSLTESPMENPGKKVGNPGENARAAG